jgi:hypothetical protein
MRRRIDFRLKGRPMSDSEAVVCGLYRNAATLDYAICHLRNVGFLDENFSVVFPSGSRDPIADGPPGAADSGAELVALWNQDILLSIRCQSSGQAAIAEKILECTDADTVVSSAEESGIAFSTQRLNNLA